MSRDIKFKYYIQHSECGYTTSTIFTLKEIETGTLEEWLKESRRYSVIAICEYTGLHDKNGVEIYEGDILSDNAIVEWFNELCWDCGGSKHPGFYCRKWFNFGEDGELDYHNGFYENIEVIGNVYDNKELLGDD